MYSIMVFLKCYPFDDPKYWRTFITNKRHANFERLLTIMKAIMLRRTKKGLIEKGELQAMPEKTYQEIEIKLDKDEDLAYQKILLFSQTMFAQFLIQQAKRNKKNDSRISEWGRSFPIKDFFCNFLKVFETFCAFSLSTQSSLMEFQNLSV